LAFSVNSKPGAITQFVLGLRSDDPLPANLAVGHATWQCLCAGKWRR
jgi:hypothetical protein